MHITPQIPDGYDGPIKKLTCRVCKRIFYITLTDYHQLGDISYCYECSLIVKEEVAKAQEPQTRPASQVSPNQAPFPAPVMSVAPHFEARPSLSRPSVQVPQPRTLDREKMTIEQLLEEAKMLRKTWRYKEALSSYDQILQQEPACLEVLSQKASLLHQTSHSPEALITYKHILQLDPESAKAYVGKGWALTSLRQHEESLSAFDQALQLDPSSRKA